MVTERPASMARALRQFIVRKGIFEATVNV